MKTLASILLISVILVCCCTSKPTFIEPAVVENRLIDSCEVFYRLIQANMIPIKKDGDFYYSVRGEWAKKSKKYPSISKIDADFIIYKNCIIGLTPKQLRGLIGEPTYIEMGYNSYFFIREDIGDVHTPTSSRYGCLSITLRDTIRTVDYWGECIRIE